MIFTENIVYEIEGKKQHLPGFDEKYVNIVDYILKITDEIWEQRAIWVINDTYTQGVIVHIGGGRIDGLQAVINGTIKTLAGFPDRKMGGETVIWAEDEAGQFFSSHRIASTATNNGATDYGLATNKKVFFRTIADCMIRENKIFEEWLVRDNLYLIQQLGFDPVEMARRDTRYQTVSPRDTCPDLRLDMQSQAFAKDTSTYLLAELFHKIYDQRQWGELAGFYQTDAAIHAICGEELIGGSAMEVFLKKLLGPFSNTQFKLERITSNQKESEEEVAVRWKIVADHTQDGFFGKASGQQVVILGINHYIIKEGKIAEEWWLIDGFDVLCQIHQQGAIKEHNPKKHVLAFLNELNSLVGKDTALPPPLSAFLSPNIVLNVSRPFDELKGITAFANDFWLPLTRSFPDLEIQPYILMGGAYEGRQCVACTGNIIGTFQEDWLGIPAHKGAAWIRFAAHFIVADAKITHAWFFLDVIDVIRQAGFQIVPQRAAASIPPGPMNGDGILTYATEAAEGVASLNLVNSMLAGLGSYDQKTLDSMRQERFWDIQHMMWYGPGGIGTTRGLKGFQDYHQVPFISAFPDRGITPKDETLYFAQFGEGSYAYDFGFPSMYGSHQGDGWLGLPATGKTVTMRVVDFWRREGNRLKENWVMIDIVDLLEQLGFDVFAELEKLKANQDESK